MKINISYFKINMPKKYKTNLIIKKVLKICKAELKMDENLELSILITSKEHIKELNFRYRNINKYTNVLSFSQNFDSSKMPSSNKLLGDLVLCPEKIRMEAKLYLKKFEDHFSHVILHGLLHLLGYNHSEKKDKLIMEYMEKKILSKLLIGNPYVIGN